MPRGCSASGRFDAPISLRGWLNFLGRKNKIGRFSENVRYWGRNMTSPNSDRIAICGEIFPRFLKHRLLFFDRIGVSELESTVRLLRLFERGDLGGLANDLEFLQSKNYVFEAEPFALEAEAAFRRSKEVQPEQAADISSAASVARQVARQQKRMSATAALKTGEFLRTLSLIDRRLLFSARMCARHMQHVKGLDACAVTSSPFVFPKKMKRAYDNIQRPSTEIIEMVLDKLPMPSEETPWEKILDFKSDTEAQGYLNGLKVWMGEIARQKLTATEAGEKLDWLLFQHQQHLKAHKLSCRWGTVGGTFVAAAEILEDLVKIKWGKAAGAVVSIVDRRLELMKAELANPAKEISYIVKAQEQFGE